jgi:integrase
MITEEEAMRMIKAASKPRDKAMLAFMFDSGCRIGELMNLRIKDIDFKGEVAQVTLNGKTGMRRIPIINSGVYLSQWLAMHPARDEPDAMVFCSLFLSKRTLRPMSYQKIVMRIK